MNKRLTTILFFAFVIAALCSYLVYRIAGTQMRAAAKPSTTKIVTAARDLDIGTLIKDTDVSTGEWVGSLPKGALVAKDKVVGRGGVSQLTQGEPILDGRLAPAGSGGGLAATIRPGMRACAVRVNDVVGVAGFVLPGMRVDVLVTGKPSTLPDTVTRTVLQNIAVLSAGQTIQTDGKTAISTPVVTLLVTPDEAES